MNNNNISGAEAIKALREGFDMLMEGKWVPDPASIEASITMLDHIEEERGELLKVLKGLLEWGKDNVSPVSDPAAHQLLVAAYHAIEKATRKALKES